LRSLFTVFKLAATGALLWFIFDRIDFAALALRLSPKDIAAGLLAGVSANILQAIVFAYRLRACLRIVGHRISPPNAWITTLFGGLFSHTPISFMGGDAIRVWYVAKCGTSLNDATKAVILDRIIGFIGIMFMVLATAPVMISTIERSALKSGYVSLITVGVAMILGFLVAGFIPQVLQRGPILGRIVEYASLSRHLARHPREAMAALGLAVIANLFNVIAIWLVSRAYGYDIGFYVSLVAAPAIFLIAMVPISVAGWGVREGAAVVALGLFAISAEQSVTVSVTVGIAVALTYSPALILFPLIRRKGGVHDVRQ
jgi:uncharacterized membrane protein YbhN (UPF0104 family)